MSMLESIYVSSTKPISACATYLVMPLNKIENVCIVILRMYLVFTILNIRQYFGEKYFSKKWTKTKVGSSNRVETTKDKLKLQNKWSVFLVLLQRHQPYILPIMLYID